MKETTDNLASLKEIRSMLSEILDVEEKLIDQDAHFVEDLEVDSLMASEVMVTMEKTYKIKISEDELTDLVSLIKVYEIVNRKILEND
jgi:acyl carrier protein